MKRASFDAIACGRDVLGTAPGGIGNVSHARALALGVPFVTACHVTRVVVLLLITGPLFARLHAWRRRGASAREQDQVLRIGQATGPAAEVAPRRRCVLE
jgi:hypothetical protein